MSETLRGSAFVAQALMAPARGADSTPGLAPLEVVGASAPGAENGALSVKGTCAPAPGSFPENGWSGCSWMPVTSR